MLSQLTQRPVVLLLLLVVAPLGGFVFFLSVGPVLGGDGFPLWVVDGFGRNVTIDRLPTKIVSLSPSNTEVLFAVGAGSRVVGVTRYCDYPPEVLGRVGDGSLVVVGGFVDPNVEVIVSLEPDLVLASGDLQLDVVSNLEAKGLTVVALYPRTVEDVVSDVRLAGRIVGSSDKAERLADSMAARIAAVVEGVERTIERPRVYYEVWYDPLMSVGPGTYLNDLIEMAGGVNIFADSKAPYPIVNPETIIEADPEIIIVAKGYMGLALEETRSEIRDRPGWGAISAVRNDKVYEVDEDTLYRHGPRIVDGLEVLARIIHPELYPETGLHRLVIQTSPGALNFVFEVDGAYERTGMSGTVSLTLKKGTHTVRLLNSSIVVGASRLEFLGWTGATSGKEGYITLSLEADATLTANYYLSTTSPSRFSCQLGYIIVAAVVGVVAVLLVALKLGSKRME